MGNSGSVHHMQSGLKELHSYYQVQTNNNGDGADDFSFLNDEPKSFHHKEQKCLEREKSLPRSKFSRIPSSSRHFDHLEAGDVAVKNSQIKVLPNLNENLRLRTTTNGAILQSGGTISGRRDSLLPQPMAIERSKTFIAENSGESFTDTNAARSMPRRSQTQLTIDLRKGSIQSAVNGRSQQLQDSNAHYKRFTSNLDLKVTTDSMETDLNASVCNSSESYQKLSKVKIKNKKRKAPPVPPLSVMGKSQESLKIERQNTDLTHKEMERKQRLFKTKSETIFQASIGSYTRPQPVNPKISSMSRQQPPVENIRASYRSKINHKSIAATTNIGFRREKSFDATLLSSRNKDTIHQETSNLPKTLTPVKRKSLQLPTIPILPIKTDFKTERSDFKIELEAATKCRLMSKNAYKSADYKPNGREPSTRQREPNMDKPKPVKLQSPPSRTSKPETQSKIPQLKKTFYFGMESSKRKPVDSSQKINPKTSKDEVQSTKSTSTASLKNCDPVYSLNHKYSSETNDNGIQVSVRPMLPRRQLEIPRFSPVAAWRTLSEEYRKQALEPTNSPNVAIEAANTFLIEDRIYRTYREPCPFYPDNKSGDSGISGDDAYLPEKPIQPRNLIQNECDELMAIANLEGYPVDDLTQPMKVVGPFLSPWTPQQDLEEEDTSSDGDLAVKLVESQSPTSAHVFSLSLPRENQLSVYGEKSKPDFRSLQKLKRSVSGEYNGSSYECTQSSEQNLFGNICLGNYRSDNWLLSKTGLASNNEQSVACSNQITSNKKSSFLDLSVSIQPMSLGCLATGKHVMYLPNRPIKELKRQPTVEPPSDVSTNIQDNQDDSFCKNIHTRNKRFSFQSSMRQIERRRLAEKLSKDAEQKEALRKSELEAMRRVEEEFQRKRAYEKASIRHQLRLYSMDDDNFTSLPIDYTHNSNGYRAEPDGAVSSTSVSPILRTNEINEQGSYRMRKRNIDSSYSNNNNEYYSNNKIGNDITMIFANS